MLELDKVDRALFAPLVGETFEVVFVDGRLPIVLKEVKVAGTARPGASRDPFALAFHGDPKLRLPQQIYRLENAKLGTMDVFVVQTGADANASYLEVIFS